MKATQQQACQIHPSLLLLLLAPATAQHDDPTRLRASLSLSDICRICVQATRSRCTSWFHSSRCDLDAGASVRSLMETCKHHLGCTCATTNFKPQSLTGVFNTPC